MTTRWIISVTPLVLPRSKRKAIDLVRSDRVIMYVICMAHVTSSSCAIRSESSFQRKLYNKYVYKMLGTNSLFNLKISVGNKKSSSFLKTWASKFGRGKKFYNRIQLTDSSIPMRKVWNYEFKYRHHFALTYIIEPYVHYSMRICIVHRTLSKVCFSQ